MNRIRVLPDQIANQIAAGEVVERPASVAKELVENSLDAGARVIRVDVEAGGRRLLRVSDDGCGMTRDDAVLAFERHATSKINADSDLSAIQTLGFRGEALPSIGSVARVEMVTKTPDDTHATRLVIEGGHMQEVKDAAHPDGTTITMRDLFFNVPARRKFLRSEATESYHLTNLVTNYALAQHAVAFSLQHNGREILRTAAATDLRERVYQIFGAAFMNNLLEVNADLTPVARVYGYISLPRERRNSRDAQYLFVNGRSVRDRVLTRAVTEAYRPLLAQGAYPVAILFVDVPWADVDVNVHPAKTEVRFRRSAAVAEAVREAVQATLASAGYLKSETADREADLPAVAASLGPAAVEMPETEAEVKAEALAVTVEAGADRMAALPTERGSSPALNSAPTIPARTPRPKPEKVRGSSGSASLLESTPGPADENVLGSADPFDRAIPETTAEITPDTNSTATVGVNPASVFPPLDSLSGLVKNVPQTQLSNGVRPLGQLDQSFIVAVDDQGLLMIDQHVAHERILFDRFRSREAGRPAESQALLLPETIDLSPAQAAIFDAAQAELESFGFDLMRLSGRTIAVKAVPAELPLGEMRNFLLDVIDDLSNTDPKNRRQAVRDRIAGQLACRAAVQANTVLSDEKMTWLIDNLASASVPTTSPHGRPVILRLAVRDLEKAFRR
ncbi:MAG: DNA mismatch repair endonuclease MutL [Pyrinomonadaceae bacterium]